MCLIRNLDLHNQIRCGNNDGKGHQATMEKVKEKQEENNYTQENSYIWQSLLRIDKQEESKCFQRSKRARKSE
jgi:hypothetical protein